MNEDRDRWNTRNYARTQAVRSDRNAAAPPRRDVPRGQDFTHPPDCGCELCLLRDPVHPQTLSTRVPRGHDAGRDDVAVHEFIDYQIGEDWSDD